MKLLVIVGVVVVLAGVSLILNAFHVQLPLFRLALGVVLTWAGASLVLDAFGVQSRWLAFQQQRTPAAPSSSSAGRQDILFSEQELDFTHLQPGEHVKVSVLFADATVRYDPRVPLELHATTAFGTTRYPDGTAISFGERTLATPRDPETPPAIVEVSTVFGSTRFLPAAP